MYGSADGCAIDTRGESEMDGLPLQIACTLIGVLTIIVSTSIAKDSLKPLKSVMDGSSLTT